MATYGNLWHLMATYGILWKLMATYDNLWQVMANVGNLWQIIPDFLFINNNTPTQGVGNQIKTIKLLAWDPFFVFLMRIFS